MEKDLFESNNVQETVNEMKKILIQQDWICVLFPVHIPGHPIWTDREHSVVGRRENHKIIVKLLEKEGLEVTEMRRDAYLILKKSLTDEKRKQIYHEANAGLSWWYD